MDLEGRSSESEMVSRLWPMYPAGAFVGLENGLSFSRIRAKNNLLFQAICPLLRAC